MIELGNNFQIIQKDQTEPAKMLVLCDALEGLLNQVKDYKALNKFERLLFKPLPDDASKYANAHHESLALTEWGYYTSEYGHGPYKRIEFNFYNRHQHGGSRENLCFSIESKSIPDLIEGLKVKRESLKKWLESYEEVTVWLGLESTIEKYFNSPMTLEKFENYKKVIIEDLQDMINQVKELKP